MVGVTYELQLKRVIKHKVSALSLCKVVTFYIHEENSSFKNSSSVKQTEITRILICCHLGKKKNTSQVAHRRKLFFRADFNIIAQSVISTNKLFF